MATSAIKTRQLTISSKPFPRKAACRGYTFLPQIQLQGRWLEDAGFACGQIITVKHKRNMIVITHQNAETQNISENVLLANDEE